METRVRTLVVEDDSAPPACCWRTGKDPARSGAVSPGLPPTGEEGMRLIRDWQPQLVLLDLIMPQCSGISPSAGTGAGPASGTAPASWSSPRWAVMSSFVDQVLSMGVDLSAETSQFE